MTRFAPCAPALIAFWLSAGLAAAATETPAALIPLEHFFAEPDIRMVQVSPGGKHLAFLSTLANGKVGVALMEVATGKVEPLVGANDENIDQFVWKGDDTVVYVGDLQGNESGAWRSISLSKRRVVQLAESYRERVADLANQAVLIDELRFDPAHLLVLGNKAIGDRTFGVWKLDVRNGRRSAVEIFGKEDLASLVADNAGRILARTRYSGNSILHEVRPDPMSTFRKIAEFPADQNRWRTWRFQADNETLYVSGTESTDTDRLFTVNVRTGEKSDTIFHHPTGNINNVILSYDRRTFYGVTYTTDKTHAHWVDPQWNALMRQVDASLPETSNEIVSRSADEKLLVFLASSDRNPGTYYLLDRNRGKLMPVGKINARLDPAQLAAMEPISFTARDGLTIHGYLTRPRGSDGKLVPLIINPHGGPYGIRDYWGYNAEVQFLANRGYAVLQVNFRGSGGYGEKFLRAGMREWGGKMQDDLTDAVRWAIEQQIADPDRIAIYGASYGGYAALVGVTLTPELYRCAVNYVGVSDLGILRRWGWAGGRESEDYFREWVGTDKNYIHDRSPVNFVDRIRVPTLHAYGFNDPRVDFEHWKRLEARLKQYSKPYEAVIQDREGHGFYNESARIAFYRKLEQFLDHNLK